MAHTQTTDVNNIASNPDQIAEWVYRDSLYPSIYRQLVADSYAKKDQYRDIVNQLPIPADGQSMTILELGPSNVPLLKNAIRESGLPVEQYKLIGLDKFARMHSAEIEMLTGSATEIPLPDSSVDVVVISSVLFFVSDQQRAIVECARVLKFGGQFILSEPDIVKAPVLIRLILAYELDTIRVTTVNLMPRWYGNLLYRYRVAKNILPRIPYLIPAILINKRIFTLRAGQEGFTESQLLTLIAKSGLEITRKARTYADAYFLLISQKEFSPKELG